MYELRHYDGFRHIGHPTSDFRLYGKYVVLRDAV
jgi:hypothetical protein